MDQITQKTIYLQTNYNNKLACDYFIHIDLEPKTGIPESVLENTVFEIRTKDNSHPPVKFKLVDLTRCPLENLTSNVTYQSHGLDWFDFIKWFMEKNSLMDYRARVAIYQYRKHAVSGN